MHARGDGTLSASDSPLTGTLGKTVARVHRRPRASADPPLLQRPPRPLRRRRPVVPHLRLRPPPSAAGPPAPHPPRGTLAPVIGTVEGGGLTLAHRAGRARRFFVGARIGGAAEGGAARIPVVGPSVLVAATASGGRGGAGALVGASQRQFPRIPLLPFQSLPEGGGGDKARCDGIGEGG